MKRYQITQKLLSLGPIYLVRRPGSDAIAATIRGKFLSIEPRLTIFAGDSADGGEVGRIRGNWLRTRFTITEPDGQELGLLTFPLFSIKKRFDLILDGRSYHAAGGFTGWSFQCHAADGAPAFSINKKILTLRDTFLLEIAEGVPEKAVLLAAVAIDQRFFQSDGGSGNDSSS